MQDKTATKILNEYLDCVVDVASLGCVVNQEISSHHLMHQGASHILATYQAIELGKHRRAKTQLHKSVEMVRGYALSLKEAGIPTLDKKVDNGIMDSLDTALTITGGKLKYVSVDEIRMQPINALLAAIKVYKK
jgi:hypothetical protein